MAPWGVGSSAEAREQPSPKWPFEIVQRLVTALHRQDLKGALECVDKTLYFVADGADFSTDRGLRRWLESHLREALGLHALQIHAVDDHRVLVELLIGRLENRRRAWTTETVGLFCTVGEGAIGAIEIFPDTEIALRRARRADEALRRIEPLSTS
jgi:hypothetical protein